MSETAPSMVVLGHISGAHGVRGWVKVHSETEPPEGIFEYQPWLLGAELAQVQVTESAVRGKHLVARLEGCDDRDQALAFCGKSISVAREALPDPGRGHYYWQDLLGLEVVDSRGTPLGRIEKMLATGANDVMVVQGERERLIPFVMGMYVKSVDLAGRRIEVDWDAEF